MNIHDPNFKPQINDELQSFLPELTSDELELLTDNCKNDPKHELMPPVQVCPEMTHAIIDGHHQYAIRKKLKLSIRYVEVSMPGGIPDAIAHMVQLQLGRRNLSPSQRSSIIARAVKRYGYGGDRKSGSQATAGVKTLDEMAEMAGVSKRTQSTANKVEEGGAASVVKGVVDGKFAAADAINIVDLPAPVQEQIVEQALAAGTTLAKMQSTKGIVANPSTNGRPIKKGGELVSTKAKKKSLSLLGQLWRSLREINLQQECEVQLESVEKKIKNAGLSEKENAVPF